MTAAATARAIEDGHVFVLRGDLTKLACDAILVPTSAEVEVTRPWLPVIDSVLTRPGRGSWYAVDVQLPQGWTRGTRAFRLEKQSLDRDVWLVQTGWDDATPPWVADGVDEALRAAARHLGKDRKRLRPLIGLPLTGTGAGGLAHRRGALIAELVPRLEGLAVELGVDIALVLADDRDFAAVQSASRASALDKKLEVLADELAGKAARGELVLFIGAGVSIAAGLPSWSELLEELCTQAELPPGALSELPALDAAEVAQQKMKERFPSFMRERFTIERHALAHALLAGLRVDSVVTTNYDNGYELATAALGESAKLKVLPRERATRRSPWLLKLHGDVAKPESIVLTRQQYLDHGDHSAPLTGMVQSLLLTRHMLFVGFSLVDDTFARLTHQVRRVLQHAGEGERQPLGTVLQLRDDPARQLLYAPELQNISIARISESIETAARRLELFLDRLLAAATTSRGGSEQYLLDERYSGMPRSADELALRDKLVSLEESASPGMRRTAAWQRVSQMLQELGRT